MSVRTIDADEAFFAADGPRGRADFASFSDSPSATPHDLLARHFDRPDDAAHRLAFGRIMRARVELPPRFAAAAASSPVVWQYTIVRPGGGGRRTPWTVRTAAPLRRAIAGLVAWFATGGPVPTDDTYPDAFAVHRGGLICPEAADPLDLIAAVARVVGNEGIDYCVRTAIAAIRPSIELPDPDAWFVGVECDDADEAPVSLLWLGGRPDEHQCSVRRGYVAPWIGCRVITEPGELARALQ